MIRRRGIALIAGVGLAILLLAAWLWQRPKQVEGIAAIMSAGSQPGWQFGRSDPPGRLSLIYQFPRSRMQFVGACHQGPMFFYMERDIPGATPIARIDGVEVPMQPDGEHGGLFFEDTPESIARIARARQGIELVAGTQRRTIKPVPDIAAFVAECRRLASAKS